MSTASKPDQRTVGPQNCPHFETIPAERCAICGLQRVEKTERELTNVLTDLARAHDVLVAAERAMFDMIRRSRERVQALERQGRLRAAGSCQSCGAEAQKNRTRCIDCGRKAAAYAKRRKERAA